MTKNFVPSAGDVIWLHFNPQAGHEQAGHRPAVVLTPFDYNRRSGLCICVPLTTKIKGYPFEVRIAGPRKQVALADQIKSLDYGARGAEKKGSVTRSELDQIRQLANVLLGDI